MKFTKAVLLLVISGVVAFGQSAPAFGVFQGTASTPASLGHPCGDSSNIGSLYTQQANGGQAQVCLQTGANSLGAGAYAWTPVQTTSTSGGGSIVIATGKTFTVNNTLTLAGTDATTQTFPTTSATIARTDAGQTFTGVDVFTSATLVTPNMTLPVIEDATDTTKTAQFSLSGATTGTKTTLTFAQTVNRVVTFPDAAITVPGTVVNNCATANACSATNISATSKIVVGVSAALNGASPAIATITGMPAFTSSSSYVCTANVNSASASTHVIAINYVSSSSVTFTGANGATDTVSYSCIGS